MIILFTVTLFIPNRYSNYYIYLCLSFAHRSKHNVLNTATPNINVALPANHRSSHRDTTCTVINWIPLSTIHLPPPHVHYINMEHPNNGAAAVCRKCISRSIVLVLLVVILVTSCTSATVHAVPAASSDAAATSPSASSSSDIPDSNVTSRNTNSTISSKDSTGSGQQQPPEHHIPLVRLPSNTLLKYSAYKDVSILHFRIPSDTRTALFSFKAYEESRSAFRKFTRISSYSYIFVPTYIYIFKLLPHIPRTCFLPLLG